MAKSTVNFLGENDFIDLIASYIKKNGIATWSEMYKVVAANFNLSAADLTPMHTYDHRYQSNVMNLKSNRSLHAAYPDIVHVRNGFATRAYAAKNGLPIQPM